MAEHRDIPHPLPDLTNPDMRHEHRDVNVWAVGKVGIALVLTTIASLLLMFGMFRYLEVRENAAQIQPTTFSINPNALPPEPNVMFNQHEPQNREEILGNEEKQLKEYGWVDKEHGVVRIPIDRAMDLVVQRGVPAHPQTDQQIHRELGGPAPAQVK
ncbi:MAG TPA: hypothetical protein VGF16_00845 [Bryobacteraceae bacterium]|jgi:hypothetical protein